jgi:hypothetical protein
VSKTDEKKELNVYMTSRVWDERAFTYFELSGKWYGSEESARNTHEPPLVYVLNVRSM